MTRNNKEKSQKLQFESRIVGYAEVKPEDLLANPNNYRRHPKEQLEALRGSLREIGWVKSVIVNKQTGFVLDGHARVEEAMRLGVNKVPVTFVDITPEEESKALAILDPITNMAFQDNKAFADLIEQVTFQEEAIKNLVQKMSSGDVQTETLISEDPMPQEYVGRIKQLVIFYDSTRYNHVIKALIDLCEKTNVNDNADLLVSILKEKGYDIP